MAFGHLPIPAFVRVWVSSDGTVGSVPICPGGVLSVTAWGHDTASSDHAGGVCFCSRDAAAACTGCCLLDWHIAEVALPHEPTIITAAALLLFVSTVSQPHPASLRGPVWSGCHWGFMGGGSGLFCMQCVCPIG